MTTLLHGRFNEMVDAVLSPHPRRDNRPASLRSVDLFCGIGGFHIAATNLGLDVVLAVDIDPDARKAYQHNFGLAPLGDIVPLPVEEIPDHEILLAGFPCQPFSIIGSKRGTADPRGTLFKEIFRIVRVKRPLAVIMENVKQLAMAQKGGILHQILNDLRAMGYTADWRILNALDFGLPQKRERVFIVATLPRFEEFPWPTERVPMRPLADILERSPESKHFVSERIRAKRREAHTPEVTPSVWHENKAGHISSYPWSCALRAGASYNYLLVNGERRFTPRELLRLQGFPDTFEIVCGDSQTRRQAGNAVAVPVAQAVIRGVLHVIERSQTSGGGGAEARALSASAIP